MNIDPRDINSVGVEYVMIDGEPKAFHIPRPCTVCGALRAALYGRHRVWYCGECWIRSGLWSETQTEKYTASR